MSDKSRTKEMSKGENIVKWIKEQMISWLGHLERMEEDRMYKKIFTQELDGTRRRGRPRKSWKEEVEKDLQVLGVIRWRVNVEDRKKWKDIVRHAKVQSGLYCQWKMKKKLCAPINFEEHVSRICALKNINFETKKPEVHLDIRN